MNFLFYFGWSKKGQYTLTRQLDTPPMLLTLPLDTMLAAAQKEAKSLTPPWQTAQGGSVRSLANAHVGEAPQEAIDISVIRDIDLMQGGEHVLLKMRCRKP
jgi:hypothetical protein